MRIAVTSQNIKSVTAHAGRCRRFWIYAFPDTSSRIDKVLVQLEIDESLHTMKDSLPVLLTGIDVLITAGMGDSLKKKLQRAGVKTHISSQPIPDAAALEYLADASKLKHIN